MAMSRLLPVGLPAFYAVPMFDSVFVGMVSTKNVYYFFPLDHHIPFTKQLTAFNKEEDAKNCLTPSHFSCYHLIGWIKFQAMKKRLLCMYQQIL